MTSAFHVYFGPEAIAAKPRVRRMSLGDCFSALSEGFDDFFAMPTYPVFVGLFYAVAGIALFAMTSFASALHPTAASFCDHLARSRTKNEEAPGYRKNQK